MVQGEPCTCEAEPGEGGSAGATGMDQTHQPLLDLFLELAAQLKLTALELLRLSLAQLCARLLGLETDTCSLAQFNAQPDNKRLALAGLCGLARVWRMNCSYQGSPEALLDLNEKDVQRFLLTATQHDMNSVLATVRNNIHRTTGPHRPAPRRQHHR
jgi:hypothetical protein